MVSTQHKPKREKGQVGMTLSSLESKACNFASQIAQEFSPRKVWANTTFQFLDVKDKCY